MNQVASWIGRDLEEDQVRDDGQDEAEEDGPEDPADEIDEHLVGAGLGDRGGQSGKNERGESADNQSTHEGILAVVRTSR